MNGFTTADAGGARQFPEGFLWGTGTSAYQIEGAVAEDGRGRSIWDVFTHTPGVVYRADTGDTACDSYHRIEEDVRLLAELGVGAYRFSVAWPRVKPAGDGAVNQIGLDYYRRLVTRLRDHDIVPVATVYHWDLPQSLEDRGGWAVRETAELLAEYAAVLGDALGDQVGMWVTINEPQQIVHQGYRAGTHAPGVSDDALAAAATHHIMLGHGLVLQALRGTVPVTAKIGATLDPHPYVALEDAAHPTVDALDAEFNRMFLDPVLQGRYPIGARGEMMPPDALIEPGDMDLISAPIDFLGVNYYRPHFIRRGDHSDLRSGELPLADYPGFVEYLPPEIERTVMGWLIVPEGLYDLLHRLRAEAGSIPLYVTENGCASDDFVNPEGIVNDTDRVGYIHAHLDAIWRAIDDGVNIGGYFHWSLMDNFEWAHGYVRRFGLHYVDFATQRRTAKRSAGFYAQIAQSGVLPPLEETFGPGEETPVFLRAPEPAALD